MSILTVDAVIFDWYGTLAAPNDDDFWMRLPQIIERAGGQAHPDALADWDSLPTEHEDHSWGEDTYRDWQTDRMMTLFKRCGIAEPARTALAEDLNSIRYRRFFNVFPDVPLALEELRNRGLRLGLCSNWDWDLERHLHHNRIHELFDTIVCSASIGFRKPHPRIFAAVAERMGIPSQNMLFVGDTWLDDIEGAAASGLRPVHVARSECEIAEHLKIPCISHLGALSALL